MTDNRNKRNIPVDKMTFEACFTELEQLVNAFEQGQLPLSESVLLFERGMELVKRCTEELDQAEKKISELLKKLPDDPAARLSEDKEPGPQGDR
ncbi:exodeoxyribonuclease VII small subunit [bacterium]|nr:exodeoxyribonuclease VII small subunit [candidate division CSSED10-310 bacterium]